MSTEPIVRPGQVWADNDARCRGRRTVRVVHLDDTHARVEVVTDWGGDRPEKPRYTRIRLDRFRPTSTGYRLVSDPSVTEKE